MSIRTRSFSRRYRPQLVRLEDRLAPATFTVNTLADENDGIDVGGVSLREAIDAANANGAGADVINFSVTGTIEIPSQLPVITSELTITGPGVENLTIQRSSADAYRLIRIQSGVEVSISDLTFRGRSEQGRSFIQVDNGHLTVSDCDFLDNASIGGGSAGAIEVDEGSLTVIRCTFDNNSAEGGGAGGAIQTSSNTATITVIGSTFTNNYAFGGGAGGAITSRGVLHVSDSVFAYNSSSGSAAGAIYFDGGGSLTNSTIHGNSSAWMGGGVVVGFDGTLTILHSTITGNVGDADATGFGSGGGVLTLSDATATITNSIIAGNFDTIDNAGPQTNPASPHPDVSGTFIDGGGNLIGIVDGSTGFTLSTLLGSLASPLDPKLAPLSDYGGPTLTQALLVGSPALNAANTAAVPIDFDSDQRGIARPQGSDNDVGAFESRGFVLQIVNGNNQSTLVGTFFDDPLNVQVVPNDENVPVDGIVVTFTAPASGASLSSTPLTDTTDDNGTASVSAAANLIPGSYTVDVTAPGVSNSVSFNLTNLPALPEVTLTASDDTADENSGGTGAYTLTRSTSTGPLTVRIDLSGTTSAADYSLSIPAGGSLSVVDADTVEVTMNDGVSSVQILLTPVNDIHAEADETLILTLVGLSGYEVGTPSSGTVTIVQNDFVVINTNEAGEGTFAQAILNSNVLAGTNTITFQTSGTILLNGALPTITADVTITGPGAANLTLQRVGGGSFNLLSTLDAGTVVLSGLTFRGTSEFGHPLVEAFNTDFEVSDSVFADNSATRAGGIDQYEGDLTVLRTTFTNNTTAGGLASGGITYTGSLGGTILVRESSFTNNEATSGSAAGGIAVLGVNVVLTVETSIFTDNEATGTSAAGAIAGNAEVHVVDSLLAFNSVFGNAAGAIYFGNDGSIHNSTIHGNRSDSSSGGLIVASTASVSILHVTLTENLGDEDETGIGSGGGILALAGSSVTVTNSIVAENDNPTHPDVSGTFIDGGGNLIGIVDGSTGFTLSTLLGSLASPLDPLLAPLGDYGGPTLTQALLVGSPALNAANTAAVPIDFDSDQRGIARPQGSDNDVGAFESRGFVLQIVNGNNQSTLVGSAFADPLEVQIVPNDENVPVDGIVVTFSAPASGASLASTPLADTTDDNGTASVGAAANLIPGSYTVDVTAPGVSNSVSFNLTNTAPSGDFDVTGVQIDDGLTDQRSMIRSLTLTLAAPISQESLAELLSQLTLTNLTTGMNVTLNGTLIEGGTKVLLTFTGSTIIGGSLNDGRYELKLGENVLAEFHRLFGDLDGDADVDDVDAAVMRSIRNGTRSFSSAYNPYLDFNSNGVISTDDRDQFNRRLGSTV